MSHIHIVYGTTGGNTDLVTDMVRIVLEENGHTVTREKAEVADLDRLKTNDCLILASPTYGHGQLEDHFIRTFWKEVHKIDLDLTNHKCAVIGLGDPKYDADYNIESAIILQGFMEERGGKMIVGNLAINRSPIPQLETKVRDWAELLGSSLT